MKYKRIKLLALGVLATVAMSTTSVFATTNTNISASNASKAINTKAIVASSGTIQPEFVDWTTPAYVIIQRGGVIQIGDEGQAVKDVQLLLVGKGWLSNSDIDGIFGAKTKTAVINFQNAINAADHAGLSVDGVVGSKTWSYLL